MKVVSIFMSMNCPLRSALHTGYATQLSCRKRALQTIRRALATIQLQCSTDVSHDFVWAASVRTHAAFEVVLLQLETLQLTTGAHVVSSAG
jgi:hypothetical protein